MMTLMPTPRTVFVNPGDVFFRLTAVSEIQVESSGRRRRKMKCICECGNEVIAEPYDLVKGKVKSCGCLSVDNFSERARKYEGVQGLSRDPLYQIWHGVIKRCTWPHAPNYRLYGARGISVHPDWFNFTVFKSYIDTELGPRPKGWSLDRINNNGNYEPGNVRWADNSTQRRNRRPKEQWST